MIAAMGLPVLLVGAVATIDLTALYNDRQVTQDVADAAALQGAAQLSVESSGAVSRTEAFARAQLQSVSSHSDVTVSARQTAGNEMTVGVDTHRLSFFANLLPPGGWHTHVQAVARTEAGSPLCILTIANQAPADDLKVDNSARIDAKGCSVQANRDMKVNGAAGMVVASARAGGIASGPISPSAENGAQVITDPFASLGIDPPANCNTEPNSVGPNETVTLQPGLHCQPIDVANTGVLVLAAGSHWFKGDIQLKNKSTIDGTAGVTLGFLGTAQITTIGNITKKSVNLVGAKTGPLAGFVMVTPRNYTSDFTIPADAIDQITGAIYVPNAKLVIDGSSPIAKPSPWTVVVAKGMQVTGSADVFINSNYAGSSVPLPAAISASAGVHPRLTS